MKLPYHEKSTYFFDTARQYEYGFLFKVLKDVQSLSLRAHNNKEIMLK